MVDIVRPVPDAAPIRGRVSRRLKRLPPQPASNKKPAPKKAEKSKTTGRHRRAGTSRSSGLRSPTRHTGLHRNRCVEDIYEPWVRRSSSLSGRRSRNSAFQRCPTTRSRVGGRYRTSGRYIEDVTKRATMTWAEVLINSSNIGMIKGAGA